MRVEFWIRIVGPCHLIGHIQRPHFRRHLHQPPEPVIASQNHPPSPGTHQWGNTHELNRVANPLFGMKQQRTPGAYRGRAVPFWPGKVVPRAGKFRRQPRDSYSAYPSLYRPSSNSAVPSS